MKEVTLMRKGSIAAGSVLWLMLGACSHQRTAQKDLGPSKLPPPGPPAVAMAIDPNLKARAQSQLEAAVHWPDEIIRAHALEEVKQLNTPNADQVIEAALGDSSPLVRKAAALAAGELQVRDAAIQLNQSLDSAGLSERMAIIFALHRLGDTSHSHEFERTAQDGDLHIRADTSLMLGMLGEKSAIPILVVMLKDREDAVRLQAAEALWKLGDQRGFDALVEATISALPTDRMIAILGLAEPRDTRVLGHVEGGLTDEFAEVALVAARAAGMLGSDHGYGVALIGAKSVDPTQRTLAALAFGAMGRTDAQPVLARLLDDANPDVKLAAAGAILQLGKKG